MITNSSILGISISRNNKLVICGLKSQQINVWHYKSKKLLRRIFGINICANCLTCSSIDNFSVFVGSVDKYILWCNFINKKQIRKYFGHYGSVWSIICLEKYN